jgi:hypothetical protein
MTTRVDEIARFSHVFPSPLKNTIMHMRSYMMGGGCRGGLASDVTYSGISLGDLSKVFEMAADVVSLWRSPTPNMIIITSKLRKNGAMQISGNNF